MTTIPSEDPLSRLAQYFHYFATVHAATSSPLYAAFSAHISESRDLLELAAKAKEGQPPANLLFAAVHYLLRERDHDDRLTAYYPSLGGTRPLDPDAVAAFERYVWNNEADVIRLISTRVTNTNEVARCGPMLPGFGLIADEAQRPLHLIEVGPSCGLILCWDQYRYRFGDQLVGNPECPFELVPEIIGAMPPLPGPDAAVAARTGLEMHPVNIDDPETLAWQLALIWPEHAARAQRISAAFDVARKTPIRILGGDAVETIAGALDAVPEDQAICVHHSFAMYQIPRERKDLLSELLLEHSRKRPIWRLGLEWAGDVKGLGKEGENVLGIARYNDGAVTWQQLAFCDPHGRWINWDPQAPSTKDFL